MKIIETILSFSGKDRCSETSKNRLSMFLGFNLPALYEQSQCMIG
jgi:hypothetical protein